MCAASACASPEDLEDRAQNLSGVVSVTASSVDGDGLPWENPPKDVQVVMEGSSTVSEVLDVAEAFKREIARGNVTVFEIQLQAPGHSTLFVGSGLSPAMADRLVAAQADPRLSHYLMNARDGTYWVSAEFARKPPLDDVAAFVDEQRVHGGVESVAATYGRPGSARQVAVVWDLRNDDAEAIQARLELALAIDRAIGLEWVIVGGGGSALALFVAPEHVHRTRAFVHAHRTELVRRVTINPKGPPPY